MKKTILVFASIVFPFLAHALDAVYGNISVSNLFAGSGGVTNRIDQVGMRPQTGALGTNSYYTASYALVQNALHQRIKIAPGTLSLGTNNDDFFLIYGGGGTATLNPSIHVVGDITADGTISGANTILWITNDVYATNAIIAEFATNWYGLADSNNYHGTFSGIFTGDVRTASGQIAATFQSASTSPSIILGKDNSITAGVNGSSVSGGSFNAIDNDYSFIGGGLSNSVLTNFSAVVVGLSNRVFSQHSVICSGMYNTITNASGTFGYIDPWGNFIGSGSNNFASGRFSFIGTGMNNQSSNYWSIIVGGNGNVNLSDASFIGGGEGNIMLGEFSAGSCIVGGIANTNNGFESFLGGGEGNVLCPNGNTAQEVGGTLVGGRFNYVDDSTYAFLGGGYQNKISGNHPGMTIVGGAANTNSDEYAFIGGGLRNLASKYNSAVVGGERNTAAGGYSIVGGGLRNGCSGDFSTVLGGATNLAAGNFSSIGGGASNEVRSSYGNISGGKYNYISAGADNSSIVGGYGNITYGLNCSIVGGSNNIASGDNSFVIGGNYNQSLGDYCFSFGSNAVAQNNNSLVWSDGSGGSFTSSSANQVSMNAKNGFRFLGGAITGNGSGLTNLQLANITGQNVLTNNRTDATVLKNSLSVSNALTITGITPGIDFPSNTFTLSQNGSSRIQVDSQITVHKKIIPNSDVNASDALLGDATHRFANTQTRLLTVATNSGALGAIVSPNVATTSAVFWFDGTNLCVTIMDGGGGKTTNKVSLSAYP